MQPWLEAFAVTVLAVASVLLGLWFSRLPKWYWIIGYLLPLALMTIYGIAMRAPAYALNPPVSWMMAGRTKFAIIGFITTLLLTTPLSRLKSPILRRLVCALMVLVTLKLSVWPFIAPEFNRQYLAGLVTQFHRDGVCKQSNDYNCGPASAVTALRQLGFPAEEGELAILAHTSSAIGTPPDMLAAALEKKYAADGLHSQLRIFQNLDELKAAGLTLAIIKYAVWVDHYVTVFEVNEKAVLVGDPLLGRRSVPRAEFEQQWRHIGIVLKRKA